MGSADYQKFQKKSDTKKLFANHKNTAKAEQDLPSIFVRGSFIIIAPKTVSKTDLVPWKSTLED